MPESTRKNRDPGRFALLKEGIPPNKREDIKDLPRWVKTALVRKEVYGESYNDAAKALGRTGRTLAQYAYSPAGKRWREQLQRWADNPVELAKAYLSANALNITLDRIFFLEAAKAAGDYEAGDKIARDIMDRIQGLERRSAQAKGLDLTNMTITVNLGAGTATLEPTFAESSYEKIQDADFTVES